ncbi:MAG: hypothetical protein ACP5NI_06105 [Acetobacteraceae bacterium]
MAIRVLIILAAVFLVGAFAIAVLAPPGAPLGLLLYRFDRGLLNLAQAGVQRHLAPWIWDRLIVPVLVRPAWLVPACLGVVFAGGALTLAGSRSSRAPRRRG